MAYLIILFCLLLSDNYSLHSNSLESFVASKSKLSHQKHANYNNSSILDKPIDPATYIVGPGDKFYLSFSANNFTFNNYLTISPVGDIIIPTVGLINLNNLLLIDAYDLIRQRCKNTYNNISIDITLVDIRKFYIKVRGLSYGPDKILVSPLSNISDAYSIIVKQVGEKMNKISKRNIALNRNGTIFNIDLLNYKIFDDVYNPNLVEGDVILLHEFDKYISIYGGIVNPGVYEYTENETLAKFIKISGGYKGNAINSNIVINRIDLNNEITIFVDKDSIDSTFLLPYDHVNILLNKTYENRNLVQIHGEINTPGYYVITDGMTYGDLLSIAGGYSLNADSTRIFINNNILANDDIDLSQIMLIEPQNRSMSEISYLKSRSLVGSGSLAADNYDMTQKILKYKVNPQDEVFIPQIINYIEIVGGVVNPGRYPYIESFTIRDYINEAGGKTKNSMNKYFIINFYNKKEKIKINSSEIKNGDTIFIQTKEDFNMWTKVKESINLIGQLATLIAVLDSASD